MLPLESQYALYASLLFESRLFTKSKKVVSTRTTRLYHWCTLASVNFAACLTLAVWLCLTNLRLICSDVITQQSAAVVQQTENS